jgi:hypothetical protein
LSRGARLPPRKRTELRGVTSVDREKSMRGDDQTALMRIARAAGRAAFRVRVDETFRRAALWAPLPLLYGIAALTIIKVFRLAPGAERALVGSGAVLVAGWIGITISTWVRRRPRFYGALALDRHHQLADRVTSALAFSEVPRDERTPLMQAAIEDAIGRASGLSPRSAVPIRAPGELPLMLALLAALVTVSLLEVRTLRTLPPSRSIEPLVMTHDDLELFRELAQDLQQSNKDPDASAAAARFNQLIEDVAERRLDRREVFRRLEEVERMLVKSADADQDALKEGLAGVARELEKSELGKKVATPLQEQRLADAEKALRELAEKLKKNPGAVNKQELENLRRAMEKASQASSQRMQRIEQQRRELEEQRKRLLNKKNERDAGLASNDQKHLEQNERKLERLNREKEQAARSQRQTSQLDRELAQAAQELMKEMGESAKHMESGAEDLNRMQREQMTDQQKQQLKQRLQELRELLRQQGQGGQEQMKRLQRFSERARGGRPQQGQGQEQGGGKQGQKGPGQNGGKDQKGGGQQGTQQGESLALGRGQGSLPMPGAPGGPGSDPGQGAGDKPGGGGPQPGEGYGSGHDDNLTGEASELRGATKDVSAAAADTGEGAASSQVIHGAAERGFVGRGYRKVYTDYKTVAEQAINEDQIPAGYRFYVQRYFQLIRPRE